MALIIPEPIARISIKFYLLAALHYKPGRCFFCFFFFFFEFLKKKGFFYEYISFSLICRGAWAIFPGAQPTEQPRRVPKVVDRGMTFS